MNHSNIELIKDKFSNCNTPEKEIIESICQIFSLGGFALLDDNKNDNQSVSFIYYDMLKTCSAIIGDDVVKELDEIDFYRENGNYAVGYFSYEMGYIFYDRLSRRLPIDRSLPLFSVGIFRKRMEVADEILEKALSVYISGLDISILNCDLNMSKEKYLEQIKKIKKHIYDGDAYQVNYTLKYKFNYSGSPLKLYAEMRSRQRVEYGAYIDMREYFILSRSPELFFKKSGENIYVKPMKGTCKRGGTEEQDMINFKFLSTDEKSRAENVMIVDLLRNDLSRISQRGTVKTTNLFEVQTYETLHQMVSTISAKVDPKISLAKLLWNMFPCGSITGAPKVRTMEIIQDLEKESRGVYTGAIGVLGPNHDVCLNVAIRTLLLCNDGRGEMGVGGGIVHDSNPDSEYEECRLKGNFFTQIFSEFDLIECIRFDGNYINFDKHITRLSDSCQELGFELDLKELRRDLIERSKFILVPTKVRICLKVNGDYVINCTPILFDNENIKKIIISPKNIDNRASGLLRHKTSSNFLYQEMYSKYSTLGYYDVVFANQNDEITEGSFNNIFIRKGSIWYTPPIHCGVLPGIQRKCILESKEIQAFEKVLVLKDLIEADGVYLTNAIRGVVEVELVVSEEVY